MAEKFGSDKFFGECGTIEALKGFRIAVFTFIKVFIDMHKKRFPDAGRPDNHERNGLSQFIQILKALN